MAKRAKKKAKRKKLPWARIFALILLLAILIVLGNAYMIAHGGHKFANAGNGAVEDEDEWQDELTHPTLGTLSTPAGSRAAFCIHGQTRSLKRTIRKLEEEVAKPLDADIFVQLIGDESSIGPSHLNRTGKLIKMKVGGDSEDTKSQLKTDLSRSKTWAKSSFAHLTYLDYTNLMDCVRMIASHEARHNFRYSVIAHSRADVFLFPGQHLPRNITQMVVTKKEDPNIVVIPSGDDFGGVLDMVAVTSRRAMQHILTTRDSVTRDRHRELLEQKWLPEVINKVHLAAAGVRVQRFEMLLCRMSAKGECRYPGELQGVFHAREELVAAPMCGSVLRSRIVARFSKCCPGGESNKRAKGRVKAWCEKNAHHIKGWPSCRDRWDDPFCCLPIGNCLKLKKERKTAGKRRQVLGERAQSMLKRLHSKRRKHHDHRRNHR